MSEGQRSVSSDVESRDTGHVRRGHRGAAHRGVATPLVGRVDADAGGDDIHTVTAGDRDRRPVRLVAAVVAEGGDPVFLARAGRAIEPPADHAVGVGQERRRWRRPGSCCWPDWCREVSVVSIARGDRENTPLATAPSSTERIAGSVGTTEAHVGDPDVLAGSAFPRRATQLIPATTSEV